MAAYQFSGNYQAIRPGVVQVRYVHFTVTASGTVLFDVANSGAGGNGTQSQFYLFTADADGHLAVLVAQGLGTPGNPLPVNLAAGTYILAFSEADLTEVEARNGENGDDDIAPFPYQVTITDGTGTVGSAAEAYVGNDQNETVGNWPAPAISGHGGDDGLSGAQGIRQLLIGGAGNDALYDFHGEDVLEGGTGDDTYLVDAEGTKIVENEGAGRDAVVTSLKFFSLAGLPNIEDLIGQDFGTTTGQTLVGNDANNLIIGRVYDDALFGGLGNDTLNAQEGNDHVFGGEGNDIVLATAGNDRIDGGADSDQINGGDGNDVLIISGPGNDNASGGSGIDTLVIDYSAATLGISTRDSKNEVNPPSTNPNGGYDGRYSDRVGFSASFSSIEQFDITTGSGNDFIWTGDFGDRVVTGAGDDFLITFGGNDVLDGGTGADLMRGGLGEDIYFVDDAGDVVEENASGGSDEVRTALGSRTDFSQIYTLPANVEHLTGTAANGQGVYGNALNNYIRMGAGADLVVLTDGGVDRVEGGGGDDFFYYGAAFTESDRNDGGTGYDSVGLLGTYQISFGAGHLVGIEKLALYSSGGGGNTNYAISFGDDALAPGQELFVAATSLTANEQLTFYGSRETDGRFVVLSGGSQDIIEGGGKNDFFSGGAGGDMLIGHGGNDTLRGDSGADTLTGGAGRDFFRYESTGDSNGGGFDTITDFKANGEADRIDLSAIDANSYTAANDAFTFIGTDAEFSGQAGELRVVSAGADWFVEADTNGDAVADLVIRIGNGAEIVFAQGDFVL